MFSFLCRSALIGALAAMKMSTMTVLANTDGGSLNGNPDGAVLELDILNQGDAPKNDQAKMTSQPQQSAARLCPPPAIHTFDLSNRIKKQNKFRVGVNAIRGFDAAREEYSLLFGDYLTQAAGKKFDPPLEFEMVPMTFEDLIREGESGEMDFFLANPGVFSCLGVELDASALATVIARLDVRGRVHDLDVFAGVMIAREGRTDIQSVHDFKDKVIAAGAMSMILGGQVQFYEMEMAGVSYVMDPKQVVFTYNQFDIVNGVLNGTYDVGFIRTDQIERGVDSEGNPLDTSLFNVIQPKIYVMENGDIFPFLHSTDIFPEFAFGTLPGIDKDVAEEVQNALFALSDHAAAAEGLQACYSENTQEYCDSLQFPESFVPFPGCDTTEDLAWLALNASRAASVAGFRTARSYASVRTMHEAGKFMLQDDKGDWKCTRAENFYDGILCPSGYIKVDEDTFTDNCDKIGLPCKEGYDCFCKPCRLEVDLHPIEDSALSDDLPAIGAQCSKNELCTSVEQTKPMVFHAFDNSHRDEINVRAVMIFAGVTTELPVHHIDGTSTYEFIVSHTNTGIASIDIYVNDLPIPSSPFQVEIKPRQCDSDFQGQRRKPTEDGSCICDGGDLEMGGRCIKSVIVFSLIAAVLVTGVTCIALFYMRHKRQLSDQLWLVNAEELHFNEPLDVIGEGGFGQVVLAEYRGTKVAIKRVLRPDKKRVAYGSSGQWNGGSVNSFKDDAPGYAPKEETPSATDDSCDMQNKTTNSDSSELGGGDIEQAVYGASASMTGTGHVDLDLLAKFDGGKHTGWCPGAQKDDYRHTIKSNILGSSTGGSTTRSTAARVFFCFDKQKHQRDEFVMEMRLLSRLRHPCITTVMGAVISSFHDPMLVMEYMEYGSLHDLLQNETLHTGGDMILQILRDIAQGLRYLHSSSPPICHGDLKARNILIDSRFRAKVADFGLSSKKKNGLTGTPYFMAPEYLRGRSYSPACDIYSFGMIMYEIYARKDPYRGEALMKVLCQVCDPSINRRPKVPEEMPQKMVDVMKKCWSADPFYRPHAKDLDMSLMDMNAQEAEPSSREQRLNKNKENKSTQDLLYEVFPRHIADALKAGRKVEPEDHELVTIFFSDIVGFTTISQTMPPIKVSEMLERLYTCFDRLARAHKVFKVETIGDAYMGVTNLEQNQENEHVKNIAEFAIEAVEAANKILIDEDNPARGCIQIRVGFHSGSVVSNVIGSLNPRYGLFGDAVNTASRMESNSRAGRILCSEFSANLLREQAPKLVVRRRGKVQVKGKGSMMTYWVHQPKTDQVSKEASTKLDDASESHLPSDHSLHPSEPSLHPDHSEVGINDTKNE